MRGILTLGLFIILAGCGAEDSLAIHGDSTAIASRSGFAKVFNIAPSWDWRRWWVIVSSDMDRKPYNDGVGGQNMHTMRVKMEADHAHTKITTIIYDRRNDDEDAQAYVADLSAAVASLQTDHFLILPQVPQSRGKQETQDQTKAMAEIDRQVLALWPKNTFSPAERQTFLAELSPDDTRFDGLHRNGKGQGIEARFIESWLKQRGW